MNKERRKAQEKLVGQIETLGEEMETLRDEEQEYYDNMPESLQGGEKGKIAQSAIDSMESAIEGLDEAVNNLQECQ